METKDKIALSFLVVAAAAGGIGYLLDNPILMAIGIVALVIAIFARMIKLTKKDTVINGIVDTLLNLL